MAYADLLKDPRWQKKRLKIFERDKFRCKECGCEENTLHVHHIKYFGKPWEAPDDFLVTLCQGCHEYEEHLKNDDSVNKLADYFGVTRLHIWKGLMMVFYCKENEPTEFDKIKKICKACCYDNGNQVKFSDFVIKSYHGQKIH